MIEPGHFIFLTAIYKMLVKLISSLSQIAYDFNEECILASSGRKSASRLAVSLVLACRHIWCSFVHMISTQLHHMLQLSSQRRTEGLLLLVSGKRTLFKKNV